MRSPALAALSLLATVAAPLACTDRPILDGYEGATDGSDTAATSEATAATTAMTGPTSGPSTGPTSGPSTSSTASTSGPSTSATTSNPTTDPTGVIDVGNGYCGDYWCSPVESCESCPSDCGCALPAGLAGCSWEWGYASVYGATSFGDFYGYIALFAWEGFGDQSWSTLNLHFYDASEVLPNALAGGPFDSEPFAARAFTGRPYPEWVSTSESYAWIARDFKVEETSVSVAIEGMFGSWEVYDPQNPPRLYGFITDPNDDAIYLDGYFEAVFCDQLVSWVIPE